MNFENKLISGQFIKRYKRFFVDVKINGKIITAHCPNTGSMYGLLKKNNKVWLTKSNNLKRKLKYTLQIIQDKKTKVVWFGFLEPQSNGKYNILDKSQSTGKTIGKLAENIQLSWCAEVKAAYYPTIYNI